ncbi:MAG TPA: ThiF family adenylyltransferase [Chloroflexia bacterium]|nr:ThiF family adenylyltransferase [Chloroflexia bacterium]
MDPWARYARQMVLPGVGRAGQERLAGAWVAILGLGALGSALAASLTRAGVGGLRLIDRDYLELHNLQRQSLYTEADVAAALPKAVAAAAHLAAINSGVARESRVVDVTAENIADLLAGTDLVLDATDNFAARYLLNDACVQAGRPWIYSGVLGTAGMVMAVQPGQTACLRCVFPEPPPPGSSPTCETAGVLGPAVQVVAGLAAAAALQLVLGATPPAGLLALDVWTGHFDRLGPGAPDPACPACGRREFAFLGGGARASLADTQLCGRQTVQVRVAGGAIDLAPLAARWRATAPGQVLANPYLVRLTLPAPAGAADQTLTLFPDGRAIVQGTDDPALARSLVARYVGY